MIVTQKLSFNSVNLQLFDAVQDVASEAMIKSKPLMLKGLHIIYSVILKKKIDIMQEVPIYLKGSHWLDSVKPFSSSFIK